MRLASNRASRTSKSGATHLEQLGAFGCAAHGVAGQLAVGPQVAQVVVMQRGLVGHGVGHMVLTGAGLADDQRVGALAD